MPAPRNDLPFQYQMRGQQLQYLGGDAEAHAIDQRDRDLEDFLGQHRAGDVLWQRVELVSFDSFMNDTEDRTYQDTAGVFSFPTVSTFEATAIYMKPDRAASVALEMYSNSQGAPPGLAGTVYSYITGATAGPDWCALHGPASGSIPLAANAGGAQWTMRFYGVTGGVTAYSGRFNLRMIRTVT